MLLLNCSVMSDPPGSVVHGDSPGKNTGVGCCALLQGIFPTQGLNPDIPHCRQILYCLNHEGSPSILEWVAYPFSSGSSWPMNRTRVSCIADRFLTSWATRYSKSKNGSDTQTSPGARERDKIIWNKMSHYFWVVKNEYASVYYTSVCVEMYAFMEGVKGPWCESL